MSKHGVFSGPYFPAFGLKYLSVFSPNAGKYAPENTPYLDTFHAVLSLSNQKYSLTKGIQVHIQSQLTFTYSKSTIETLEKGVKHIQSQ